jgi:hypothetical protein
MGVGCGFSRKRKARKLQLQESGRPALAMPPESCPRWRNDHNTALEKLISPPRPIRLPGLVVDQSHEQHRAAREAQRPEAGVIHPGAPPISPRPPGTHPGRLLRGRWVPLAWPHAPRLLPAREAAWQRPGGAMHAGKGAPGAPIRRCGVGAPGAHARTYSEPCTPAVTPRRARRRHPRPDSNHVHDPSKARQLGDVSLGAQAAAARPGSPWVQRPRATAPPSPPPLGVAN